MSDIMTQKTSRSDQKFRNRAVSFASLLVGVGLAVSGCEAIQGAESSMQVDSAEARVTMDRFVQKPGPMVSADTVRSVDGIWLGAKSVRATKGEPLPKSTEMVTLISAEPLGLQDIATEITTLTGVPVVLDLGDDVDTGAAVPGAATGSPDNSAVGSPGNVGISSITADANPTVEASSDTIQLSYSGPLGGLLDLLSTRFGISWEYKNGTLRLLNRDTRVFTVYTFPGTSNLNSSVSNNSNGGGGGFGLSSTQSATRTLDSTPFTDLVEQVTSMVGDNGTVTAAPASSTITVSARPFVLDKVADFIDEQNERMTRQIALQIQVLNIARKQDDKFNLDLTTLFNNGKYNLSARSASPSPVAATSTGALAAQVVDTTSNFNGSRAIMAALATETKSSLVNSTNLVTTNGIPVPFQVVRQTRFIAEQETTVQDGITTITSTVEDLITGFSVQLTPRIVADGGVMVSYALALTELVGLDTINTGGESGGASSVQIPTIDVKSVIQQAVLKNNETLVLSGFEQADNKTSKNGTGLPENVALGGSQTGTANRVMTLVLITPKIIDARTLLRGDQL